MMIPLYTPDLLLLPASGALAGAAADYYARNRTFLQPFDPAHAPSFYTAEGQRPLLEADAEAARLDRSYRFLILRQEAPEQVIGTIALSGVVRGAFHSAFVGYKLDAAWQGRGYMTQALLAVTGFAFGALNLHRLEINVMPRNPASQRVAEKAGFVREGLSPQYLYIGGVWEDHLHFVRLNPDWRP